MGAVVEEYVGEIFRGLCADDCDCAHVHEGRAITIDADDGRVFFGSGICECNLGGMAHGADA